MSAHSLEQLQKELEEERGKAWRAWQELYLWQETAHGLGKYYWWLMDRLKKLQKKCAKLVLELEKTKLLN